MDTEKWGTFVRGPTVGSAGPRPGAVTKVPSRRRTRPMPAPLGCCLVGTGMIARLHLRALQAIPGARVTAVVSRSPANAATLVTDTGLSPVPVYPAVAEAVADPAV